MAWRHDEQSLKAVAMGDRTERRAGGLGERERVEGKNNGTDIGVTNTEARLQGQRTKASSHSTSKHIYL